MFQILISNQKKKIIWRKSKETISLFVYFYFLSKGTKKKTYNDIATRTDTLTIC